MQAGTWLCHGEKNTLNMWILLCKWYPNYKYKWKNWILQVLWMDELSSCYSLSTYSFSSLCRYTGIRIATMIPEKLVGCSFKGLAEQLLTGGNWQKWKRVFLTCPCHTIYRDEAVGLKSCKYTWKITKFVKMGNLGQISWKFDILSITS